jgi:putative oxidoreductase
MEKHGSTVTRLLLGLMFTAAAVAGMMGKIPPPEPEQAQLFMGMLASSGLIFLVKISELVCGLALLSGRFVPLALLVLAPIVVNISFYHVSLDPAGIPASVVLLGLWGANAFFSREAFGQLFQAKI